jgi:hypothetical protein
MAAVTPLSNAVRHKAAGGAKRLPGNDEVVRKALNLGAFDQLMVFLAHPDPNAWRELAQATALSVGSGGALTSVEDLANAVAAAASGAHPTPAGHETGSAAMVWASQNGQEGVTVLEREGDPLPTTVLSYDTSIETDRNRWSDWLHLANILQHLGEHAIITTTSTYSAEPSIPSSAVEAVAESMAFELLADVVDSEVLELAGAAVSAGWRDLVVGFGAGDDIDTPIEVAWPAAGVGILPTGVARPSTLANWDLREPSAWTNEELLEALRLGLS